MKYNRKFIEDIHSWTPAKIRHLFKKKGYGRIHTREIKISKESKQKANLIVDSFTPMIKLYRQTHREAGSIIPFYNVIQRIHRDMIRHAERKNIEMNDEIDTAIYERVYNAVIGFFVQDYGMLLLLDASEEIIILSTEELDLYGGVDFIVIHIPNRMAYYVHVTTDTEGKRSIDLKELKDPARNFSRHCHLFYDREDEGNANYLIEKVPFFTLPYLRNSLSNLLENDQVGINIDDKDFRKEIKEYKGEWKFTKSNNLLEEYEIEVEEIISSLEE